jgi:hypothetical protein
MKIFLSIISLILTTAAHGGWFFSDSLKMYEKPDASSKVVATIDSKKQFIPIFYTDKKDWIKIANPQNGDVGWIETNKIKGPLVSTEVNGNSIQQKIIYKQEGKDKEPVVYSVVQYSGPEQVSSKDASKMIKEIQERHEKMRLDIEKTHNDIQKSIQDMFKRINKDYF